MNKIFQLVNNSPLYNFLRFNIISDFIVEQTQKITKKNVSFYSSFLSNKNKNSLIFDIGANKGNKTKAFLKMGYSVIALEPETKSLKTLNYRYKNNNHVTIVPKGVSFKEGSMLLNITESRSGLNTFSDKWIKSLSNEEENRWNKKNEFTSSYEVPITTLDLLMKEYGIPYFIKIDVEGFELNVIKGMKQTPQYLTFELNLPEFNEEANEIIDFLSKLDKSVKFQYSFEDKLETNKWISKEEIIKIINGSSLRYLEVICSFDN